MGGKLTNSLGRGLFLRVKANSPGQILFLHKTANVCDHLCFGLEEQGLAGRGKQTNSETLARRVVSAGTNKLRPCEFVSAVKKTKSDGRSLFVSVTPRGVAWASGGVGRFVSFSYEKQTLGGGVCFSYGKQL